MNAADYQRTIRACFIGYVVQAVVNNFLPLLFLTLQRSYGIPLGKITLLVTMNFGIQLAVDLLSALFVDRIGYRRAIVAAHVFSAAGFVLLTLLPQWVDPYVGIVLSVVVYAVGGGLIEVLVSPIMESCPTENKEKAMSLLHSFYCWGHVGVVLLSTAFFALFGMERWRLLALAWAMVPLANGLLFLTAPIAPAVPEGERGMSLGELARSGVFWLLMLMMLCAGASEQAVSQWASAFAESALGVGKSVGDLLGPMAFAVLMGSARAFYGKYGDRIRLERFMLFSGVLCIASYLIISLAPHPAVSLAGCAVCGLSVGILWPGTFSRAATALRNGGTAMFALLALAGDLGCSGGPTLAGLAADAAGGNLRTGILSAVVFPAVLVLCLFAGRCRGEKIA